MREGLAVGARARAAEQDAITRYRGGRDLLQRGYLIGQRRPFLPGGCALAVMGTVVFFVVVVVVGIVIAIAIVVVVVVVLSTPSEKPEHARGAYRGVQ